MYIINLYFHCPGFLWARDEHKSFLVGLENLGKGDWRGIPKKYVQRTTSTEVSTQAQKYFIKIKAQNNESWSLFDMPNYSMTVFFRLFLWIIL